MHPMLGTPHASPRLSTFSIMFMFMFMFIFIFSFSFCLCIDIDVLVHVYICPVCDYLYSMRFTLHGSTRHPILRPRARMQPTTCNPRILQSDSQLCIPIPGFENHTYPFVQNTNIQSYTQCQSGPI